MQSQHPLADVVVVGTRVDVQRLLHRNFRREIFVNDRFGEVVTLPSPILNLNTGCAPFREVGSESLCEEPGVLGGLGTVHIVLEDRYVPDIVEIERIGFTNGLRSTPEVVDRDATSASIVVGTGVKRHVQVSNKVNDVANGVGAFVRIGGRIFQNGELIGDRLSDATTWATKFRKRRARGTSGDVDVVPRTVLRDVAHIVGPGGSVGEEVVGGIAAVALEGGIGGIFGEQLVHELEGFRSEVQLGEQCNGLMAFAAPRTGGKGGQ